MTSPSNELLLINDSTHNTHRASKTKQNKTQAKTQTHTKRNQPSTLMLLTPKLFIISAASYDILFDLL